MQRKLAGKTRTVGLWCATVVAFLVSAANAATVRIQIADENGVLISGAKVELLQAKGKPQQLKQVDKQTWVFETDQNKVQLDVKHDRSGGVAELELQADPTAEFSYLLHLRPNGIKSELVLSNRGNAKKPSDLRQNLGTTKAEAFRAPPANDLCTSAIAVSVPSVTSGTTVDATVDSGLPSCTTSVTAGGVWYSFTGTGTSVTASLCTGTPYDSKLTVFSGSCATPVCVAGNDDTSGCGGGNDASVTFCATLGVNYLVLVHGFSSGTGAFELTLASGASCAPPANDLCVNATPIGTLPASVSVNNTFATNDTLVACGSSPHNRSTWYTVVGDGTTFTASTCNAGTTVADTELIVYCGDCATPLCIGGDDDGCPGPPNPPGSNGNQSIFTWCTQPGATYLIAIGNFSSTLTGTIQLDVSSSGSACSGAISCLAITGACCNAGACTGTTDQTSCETAGGTWFIGESCPAFACPSVCVGDTCAAAISVPSIPYNGTGDTCSCADDYDSACPYTGSTSSDVVYKYRPTQDTCVDISLCNGSDYDTKVYVYQGSCGGAAIACNDDACSSPNFPFGAYISRLTGVNLLANTDYFIVVDGYGGECGNYVLDITPCTGPCNVTCSPGSIPEGEPDCGLNYDDQFNGGCNSIPPVFSNISCGQTACGESGTFLADGQETCLVDLDCPFVGDTCVSGFCRHQFRDTDWYKITLATDSQLTWTVETEFPGLFGIVDTGGVDDCTFVTSFLVADFTDPCTPNSVTAPVPAGTWYLFVSTADFTGVACGSEYTGTVDCAALPDGACCAASGSCSITTQPACVGVWQGPGTGCTPNPCPQPPPNDHCDGAIAVTVPSTTAGTTVAADVDTGFPSPCGDATISSPGVWYSVIGTGNQMTVSLCNGNTFYDSKISVFCPDCVVPVCVNGNDDTCGLQSETSWCSSLGQNYLILVHGFGGDNGPFELTVTDDGAACPSPASCVAVPVCPGIGDCCDPAGNGGIGCNDETCCSTVCALDPYCCGQDPVLGGFWDDICAGEAASLCEVCVPEPLTGGCCQGLGCSILTQADCATAGGTYLGDGSDCSGPGAGNPRVYQADPGLAIPDGDPVGISDVINVPDSFTIGSVDVDLRIPHTWVGDLIVTITHNATSVTVVDRMGFPTLAFGCNSNDLDVLIDDDGTGGPIENLCGPGDNDPTPTSPPSYLPANSLSAFNGMNSSGPWTITVSDNAGFDTGTLEHWSLHIDEPGPSPCVPHGACCISETVCVIQTQAGCTGVYLGDGTTCGAGGPVTTFVSDPNLAIPDNDPLGVSDSINVPASFTLTDVDVDLVVPHTWVGDLIVTLTHGSTVTIIDRIEFPTLAFGCNSNDLDIVLDDEGTGGAIEDNCGPSDASSTPTSPPNYIPSGALSAFDGMDSSGTWTINISDNAGFDTGSLVHWSLHLQQAGPGPCQGAFTGACCDTNGPNAGCVDGVTAQDCVGPDKVFTPGATCNSPNYTCACVPACGGRECGDNGCGGSCGSCDDGNACTTDSCDGSGQCVNAPVVCNDNVACTSDACVNGACQFTPNDAACDDGFFCTGVETCSASGCVPGTPPCTAPATCNEDSDTCETGAIPTVSAWGLAVLALVLMVGAKLGFGRKEATA